MKLFIEVIKEELYILLTVISTIMLLCGNVIVTVVGTQTNRDISTIFSLIILGLISLLCGGFFHSRDLELMQVYRLPFGISVLCIFLSLLIMFCF